MRAINHSEIEESSLFLFIDRKNSIPVNVFFYTDPREDGCKGEVETGVKLDYDFDRLTKWPQGSARPMQVLGRDPKNTNYFKVFKYDSELREAGFVLMSGGVLVLNQWSEYER